METDRDSVGQFSV